MTSSSERVKAIEVGYRIHRMVIDEGKREGVYANLDHELIGSGKLPFLKWDPKTKETHRRFSKSLADEIRSHVAELKIYFDYVRECDKISNAPVKVLSGRKRPTPE